MKFKGGGGRMRKKAKSTKRIRIVMSNSDKAVIVRNLLHNFKECGLTEEESEELINSGSVPITTWISRWICHNTDYKTVGQVTESFYKQGAAAWMYYKATAQILKR